MEEKVKEKTSKGEKSKVLVALLNFLSPKNILALISNPRYIPKDYGIIEATLVFFILRLTLFRPKGEEEVRE